MDVTCSSIKMTWSELQMYMEEQSISKMDLILVKLPGMYAARLQVSGWIAHTSILITDPPSDELTAFKAFMGI